MGVRDDLLAIPDDVLRQGRIGQAAVVHAHMGVSRSAVEGIVFPGVTLAGCPV